MGAPIMTLPNKRTSPPRSPDPQLQVVRPREEPQPVTVEDWLRKFGLDPNKPSIAKQLTQSEEQNRKDFREFLQSEKERVPRERAPKLAQETPPPR